MRNTYTYLAMYQLEPPLYSTDVMCLPQESNRDWTASG